MKVAAKLSSASTWGFVMKSYEPKLKPTYMQTKQFKTTYAIVLPDSLSFLFRRGKKRIREHPKNEERSKDSKY